MATVISTFLRDKIADAVCNAGAGINFDSGTLQIRSGAAPGPNAAVTGTLLASITLPADAFAAASTGACAKAGTWQDASADAAGTAAHFRIAQSGDAGGATGTTDERIEGTVTATGGGGDLELDNVVIAAAQTVTITSFTVTMPAS